MRVLRFRDWPLRLKVLTALLAASVLPLALTLVIGYQAFWQQGITQRQIPAAHRLHQFLEYPNRRAGIG